MANNELINFTNQLHLQRHRYPPSYSCDNDEIIPDSHFFSTPPFQWSPSPTDFTFSVETTSFFSTLGPAKCGPIYLFAYSRPLVTMLQLYCLAFSSSHIPLRSLTPQGHHTFWSPCPNHGIGAPAQLVKPLSFFKFPFTCHLFNTHPPHTPPTARPGSSVIFPKSTLDFSLMTHISQL